MWGSPRTSRIPFSRAIFVMIVAVLGFLGSDRRVWGQVEGPAFPESVQPALEPVPHAARYWIASSRRCSQAFQTRCPKGTLDYFAVDGQNCLSEIEETDFLASLRYDQPICFVVHGDLTSFENVRRAAPRIVKWIEGGAEGQPVQLVFYTWPSDDELNPLPQLDISARGERAEFNGCYLAQLISKFPAQTRVSFFGHSFGTRVISAALHLLAGGQIRGCGFRCPGGEPRSYRAVFAAAAIDRTWLNPNERYGRALGITQWLLNMKNGADFVINLYPLRTIFAPQALGRFGFSPRDRLLMGPLSAKISEWDVTMGIGNRHAWSFYYTRPEIARVMVPLLVYSAEPPQAITVAKPQTSQTPPNVIRDSTKTEPTRSELH